MSDDDLDPQATREAIIRHLLMIDASGPEWTEADQLRYLRVYLEEGVGDLADLDDARYRFMAECAMLAGENMQDARLHLIEQRLDDLENPDAPGFADFLVNLGLMLALELLIVASAHYAIPALVVFVSAQASARTARRLASAVAEGEAAGGARLRAAEQLGELTRQVAERRGELQWARTHERTHWRGYTARRRAERALVAAENEFAAGRAIYERSEDAARRAQGRIRTMPVPHDPTLAGKPLQDFLAGTLGAAGLGRVAEDSASAMTAAIVAAAGDDPVSGPKDAFHTSDLIGRFLSAIGRDRQVARRDWSALRRHLRALSDDDLTRSEVAHELFARLHDQADPGQSLDLVLADREFLVRGLEGALWLAWLSHRDALGQRSISHLRFTTEVLDPPVEGRVHGDLFVVDLQADLPVAWPEGGPVNAELFGDVVQFPGIGRLTEEHAVYLYGNFARAFFIANPDRAPKPMTFEATRYDEVLAGKKARDKDARIAEMKLLVIIFFQLMRDSPSAIGGKDPLGTTARPMLLKLLGLPAPANVVGDFLDALPPVSEPDESIEDLLGPQSDPDAPDTGSGGAEAAARTAVVALGLRVTELDVLITRHEALYPPGTSPDTPALSADAEALVAEIEDKKKTVLSAQATAVELAAPYPEVAAEAASYSDRVAELTAWSDSGWKIYGPPAPLHP